MHALVEGELIAGRRVGEKRTGRRRTDVDYQLTEDGRDTRGRSGRLRDVAARRACALLVLCRNVLIGNGGAMTASASSAIGDLAAGEA